MLIGNGKDLRLYSDTHAALPPLAWAANSHFPAFLRCERRKAGNFSFTAVLTGGKLDFPGFLRCERRKAGTFSFTAALIGGKLDFPVFLRCDRRKTGNCSFTAGPIGGKVIFQVSSALRGGKLEIAFTLRVHVAEIFQSDFLSFFRFFCLLVAPGSGLSSTK